MKKLSDQQIDFILKKLESSFKEAKGFIGKAKEEQVKTLFSGKLNHSTTGIKTDVCPCCLGVGYANEKDEIFKIGLFSINYLSENALRIRTVGDKNNEISIEPISSNHINVKSR